MAVNYKQFEANYGFKSPGFTVDNLGNVIVRTITDTYTPTATDSIDYSVIESSNNFSITDKESNNLGSNPVIDLKRGTTYVFSLDTTSVTFNIFSADTNNDTVPGELYNTGLSHTTSINGQNLSTDTWTVQQTWQQETTAYSRPVTVVVPNTVGTSLEGKQIPVIISLHNANQSSGNAITHLNYLTDKIIVAPQGYSKEWNVGYSSSKADDIAYLDAIVDKLATFDNVDIREISIHGQGLGGQMAHQYALQTTKTNIKNVIIESALFNEDQYRENTNIFYKMALSNLGDSTAVSWIPVTPLTKSKIVMFHGEEDLAYPFNGGVVAGETILTAATTIYGWAKAVGSSQSKLTSGTLQSDGASLYSYNSGAVALYGYPNVAQSWEGIVKTSIQTKVNETATPSSFLDIPTASTVSGAEAQAKTKGLLSFIVPIDAPDKLFYGDGDKIPNAAINVTNPTVTGIGSFSSILNTGNLISSGVDATITISPTGTGTVNINPTGGGTINNVNVNASNLTTSGEVSITPNSDVTISPQISGTLTINPTATGVLNNVTVGQSVPKAGAFSTLVSTAGTLNSTTIGTTTPANAGFLSATGDDAPATGKHLTNKTYVDAISMVYSIALGV
jgi:poly(3-hydroxybutyrate) depolymerase